MSIGRVVGAFVLLAGLVGAAPEAQAQRADTTARAERPAARPSDVESPSAIVAAVYDVISEPAGETRNWTRFRSLFLPSARLIPANREQGKPRLRVWSVADYIDRTDWAAVRQQGFFEQGVHAETERFGDIAHVFSTYEIRRSADAPEPVQRGINSFQLWFDGTRWWIVTIVWHAEHEEATLPERYRSP